MVWVCMPKRSEVIANVYKTLLRAKMDLLMYFDNNMYDELSRFSNLALLMTLKLVTTCINKF